MKVGECKNIRELMECENSDIRLSEFADMNIELLPNGQYRFPYFTDSPLSKEVVEEYIKQFNMYIGLGLSLFIPHIPNISHELKRKNINTHLDGTLTHTESKSILKELYHLLF
jgi:hypothetical protein